MKKKQQGHRDETKVQHTSQILIHILQPHEILTCYAEMIHFQFVFIRIAYTNFLTCSMDRCVAIRICLYRDHSLSHLDKALRVVLGSNMQYTCCSYVGVRCFCHIIHGTNKELKKKKKKSIEIRFHKYYFCALFCIQRVDFSFWIKLQLLTD